MPFSTHRHHVLAAVAAGLLVVAGCTAEDATDHVDQPTATDATSSPTPTGQATTVGATTPASPDDEATGDEGSGQDDAEEVVSHDTGERSFGVYARSVADGVCLEVRTGEGTDEECGPVEGDLDVRILTVGGQDHVTGMVAGAITEIDMIANDGSAIADDAATAELVEVIGQSGFRAFAAAEGPDAYSAVVGYGPDGEEVARAEL